MTKKQKRLAALVSFLCVLCVLFSLFWFVPYRRHWAFRKTPAASDELFPRPDSVFCITNGKAERLNNEEIDYVYGAMRELITYVDGTSNHHTHALTQTVWQYKTEYTCLELRYRQRQEYTGSLLGRPFQYDAVLVVLRGGLTVVPYYGCTYYGFNNEPRNLGSSRYPEYSNAVNAFETALVQRLTS